MNPLLLYLALQLFLAMPPSGEVSSTQTIPPLPQEEAAIEEAVKQDVSEVKIIVGGDVMFEAGLGEGVVKGANPFKYIDSYWKHHDLRIINLETNISRPEKGSPQPGKAFTFNAPVEAIDILKKADIDMVSLANNHTMDYQASGLLDQLALLEDAGIVAVGAGKNIDEAFRPRIAVIGDTRIAVVAINDIETYYGNARSNRAGSMYFDEGRVQQVLKTANEQADVVIVYPHWGVEHLSTPTARQQMWAKKLIDYGADLVVGAHPHIIQTHETYKGKEIYYSLGNFVFVGMGHRPQALKGHMLDITIQDKKIVKTKTVDVQLDGWYGHPTLVE